jgi:Cobinamide kinase / cobinamide phosphate guanyltransferase
MSEGSASAGGACLITGARRCGKSEWVEREATKWSSRIYVGTVGHTEETASMILRHRERRGSGWVLVESGGDIAGDLAAVDRALDASCGEGTCVIDGLTSWIVRCSPDSDVVGAAFSLGFHLADLISARRCAWRLVDVTPALLQLEGFPVHAAACRLLHRTLLTRVPNMGFYLFKEGRLYDQVPGALGG